ncbi:hypothetical protein G6F31_019711 [Rhizopus arrhizus]|nr:hypothetical protein G6F31_019711 [Rhizopus arrhizus]
MRKIGVDPAVAAEDRALGLQAAQEGIDALAHVIDVGLADAAVDSPELGGHEAVGDDVGGAHHAQELPLLVAAGGAVAPQAEATFADDGRHVGLVQQVGAAGRVGQAEVDGTRGTKHAVEFQVRRRCPPAAG